MNGHKRKTSAKVEDKLYGHQMCANFQLMPIVMHVTGTYIV